MNKYTVFRLADAHGRRFANPQVDRAQALVDEEVIVLVAQAAVADNVGNTLQGIYLVVLAAQRRVHQLAGQELVGGTNNQAQVSVIAEVLHDTLLVFPFSLLLQHDFERGLA